MTNKGNFFERVYGLVQEIPRGKVATYGQIAKILGAPKMSRFVGYALHANPYADEKLLSQNGFDCKNHTSRIVPCHRVVNRFGAVCSGFAFGGADVQRRLLEAEGVIFKSNGNIDLDKCLWKSDLRF